MLSVFFDDTNGTESKLFTHLGFEPDGEGYPPSGRWQAPHFIDVEQEISEVVKGPSYQRPSGIEGIESIQMLYDIYIYTI